MEIGLVYMHVASIVIVVAGMVFIFPVHGIKVLMSCVLLLSSSGMLPLTCLEQGSVRLPI